MNNFKPYFPLTESVHTHTLCASRMKTRAHAVLHPEFLRKTKTAQNDSGTVIAWHIINLNQSLHIYQHFNAEIKKSKVDLHSTYHCGAGNIANSLKDPFYSFRGEKNFAPKKRSVVEDEKQKSPGFLRWYRKQKNRARGSRKTTNFYVRKLSQESAGAFLDFQSRYTHSKKWNLRGWSRFSATAPPFTANPPVWASLRSGSFTRDRHRQQLSSCAVSAHGLWVNWCSVSIHLTGDPISMTSSSSSVQGLHDQLLRRERHFRAILRNQMRRVRGMWTRKRFE